MHGAQVLLSPLAVAALAAESASDAGRRAQAIAEAALDRATLRKQRLERIATRAVARGYRVEADDDCESVVVWLSTPAAPAAPNASVAYWADGRTHMLLHCEARRLMETTERLLLLDAQVAAGEAAP